MSNPGEKSKALPGAFKALPLEENNGFKVICGSIQGKALEMSCHFKALPLRAVNKIQENYEIHSRQSLGILYIPIFIVYNCIANQFVIQNFLFIKP